MTTPAIFSDSLMRILMVLSDGAEQQVEYLRKIGGASVDELALEFEDVWALIGSVVEANGISDRQYDAMKKLNERLDMLSEQGGEGAWTEEALFENVEWEEVRSLAKDCVKAFSESW